MIAFIVSLALIAIGFFLVMTIAPKGWRTVIFNTVAGIPLIGAQIASALVGFDWAAISPKYAAWCGLAVFVLNIVLRAVTSSPMGKTD